MQPQPGTLKPPSPILRSQLLHTPAFGKNRDGSSDRFAESPYPERLRQSWATRCFQAIPLRRTVSDVPRNLRREKEISCTPLPYIGLSELYRRCLDSKDRAAQNRVRSYVCSDAQEMMTIPATVNVIIFMR